MPEEEQMIVSRTHDVMCNWTAQQFPWINVPLEIEFESTAVDGYWAVKEKVVYDPPDDEDIEDLED